MIEVTEDSMQLSIVVPVFNEEENLPSLLGELDRLLQNWKNIEVIFVDDQSIDGTVAALMRYKQGHPWLRVVRHAAQQGQSAALRSGILAAHQPLVATLDGDGQNDPADIQQLVAVYRQEKKLDSSCLVIGHRTRRKDNKWRKISSFLANAVRNRLLSDDTPDSGCGIRVFSRSDFLDLPSFDHMHRFLPVLFRNRGGTVVSVPVNHRPRLFGRSHYGTLDRLGEGIVDLIGVNWLTKRAILPGNSLELKYREDGLWIR